MSKPNACNSVWGYLEEVARKRPDAVAVRTRDGDTTFRDLKSMAEAVSRQVQELNASSCVRYPVVALLVPRSAALLASMLGCARSGIAFAAFDLTQPEERIHRLLSQLEVLAVIGERPWTDGPLLRSPRAPTTSSDESRLFPPNFSEDLYVCFTSGSSGMPKAVRGSQTATLNRLSWMWDRFPFGSRELLLQKTSVSFVDSVWEYFGGILRGVPLYIVEDDVAKDAHRLLAVIQRTKPTRLTVVPSLVEHYLAVVKETVLRRALSSVEVLVCSGEALRWTTAGKLQQHAPSCKILNLYGSTEVTGDVSFHLFTMDSFSKNKYTLPGQEGTFVSQFVPIGLPVAGCQLHVIATDGSSAMTCTVGDLCVSGVGLSLGYLAEADSSFFELEVGGARERAYRTGDLAFEDADGLFHYVGRADDQLKINGHRVSLLEVQIAVQELSSVAEATVVSVTPLGNSKLSLCAFYTTTSGKPALDSELRSALAARLPGYMIPSFFSHLLRLPSTTTGKVDKRALESLFQASQTDSPAAVPAAASTPLEQRLLSCVSQFFGASDMSVDRSFFAQGADSLRLAQLAYRLQQAGIPAQLNQIIASPTVSSLASALEADATCSNPALCSIPRTEGPLPLTRAQAGLVFLDELHKGFGSAYAVNAAYWLRGGLQSDRLMIVLQHLCMRHPALRYRIDSSQGEPFATLSTDCGEIIRHIDLRPACVHLRGNALEEFVRHELQARVCWQPFVLSQQVAELVYAQVTDDEACLLIHAHHLAVDGWSMRLIVKDLAALFNGEAELHTDGLELADFASWESGILGSDDQREPLRQYWTQHLYLAEEACVSLSPHSAPSLGGVGSPVATCGDTLPSEVQAGLPSALQRYGISSFALMATSLFVLLHRFSQQDAVILGIPCALRNSMDLQDIVGMLVNMLPLHVCFSASDSLASAATLVGEALASGIAHSLYPFEEIVKDNCPQRQSDRNPIFQMILVQEELDNSVLLSEAGVASSVEPFKIVSAGAKCEVVFIVRTDPESGHTQLGLEYARDLFTESSMTALLRQWMFLLGEFIRSDGDTKVCEVALQSDEELHNILHGRNDSAALFPADHHLTDLFDETVLRNPDHVAIMHKDVSLSFQDLQYLSGHISALLAPHGQGHLVGICLPRGITAIAAIFGVIRANCGYVPLDPELPLPRLQHIVSTAGIEVVIVNEKTIAIAKALSGKISPVPVDSLPMGACPIEGSKRVNFNALSIAAVLFTSGSTGKPKGIQLTHRGIISRCRSNHFIEVGENDCIGQVNTLNFDLSIFEVFFSLLNGVTIAIVDKCVLLHPQQFSEELQQCGVTTLLLPTSVFHSHARTSPSAFVSLRTLMFGGEKPNSALVGSVMKAAPHLDVVNLSGPTEITFASHFHHIVKTPSPGDILPLGKSMANTSTYVVDALLQPVAEGVPGELLIGGPGLSLGYIGEEELTREKFIVNPFPALDGHNVLMRTGDMVKWLSDGNLEFVGGVTSK